ncbi:AAA family ATPase [bacterium]|nr:AAA family ATPase [bacterium]
MNHIKSLTINGFKKFKDFQINFNESMNILVGENESGKSTILEAIKVVLNQQYRSSDKSILCDLFNVTCVNEFKDNPSVKTLPKILIEIEFNLEKDNKNAEYFFGEVYGKQISQEEKYGIRFECKFNDDIGEGLNEFISQGKIPYEYYEMSWTTFANRPYQLIKRPLNFISIDTTNFGYPSFSYFNKSLFNSKYDDKERQRAKNIFRDKLEEAFKEIELPDIDERRKFGVDSKKVVLDTILSVYEESISLENRGSGMESLIKTQIALNKKNNLDVILIEEPENHLSYTTLIKMLHEISNKKDDSQIIVTTHSNLITSRLNLKHVIWINDFESVSLESVDNDVADFFVKADDNSFLQFLLSKKVILVEGATEYMLIPYFYKLQTGRTIDADEISVISCNGISYKNYLRTVNCLNKKIAVITDNDGKKSKLDDADSFNKDEGRKLQRIFIPEDLNEFTWEVCIYNNNKNLLENIIEVKSGANYKYHDKDYDQDPVLGKMLNNKVDSAYKMLLSEEKFLIPKYVEDAIEWISK